MIACLDRELKLADMARALRWLPDVYLEVRHYRTNSYLLFTTLPSDFTKANDAEALRIERYRRIAMCQPVVWGMECA